MAEEENEWRLPSLAALTGTGAMRRLAAPWRERRFTYGEYEAFLRRIADPAQYRVVPFCELPSVPPDRPVVVLRHDVDDRIDSALALARLEHGLGIRSTYFVLHTARYYGVTARGRAEHDPALIPKLRLLQDGYGHEIGWHNDLVTLQCIYDLDPVAYLGTELGWLRNHGIEVTGTVGHGSLHCRRLGYQNRHFFLDFDDVPPAIDAVAVGGSQCVIQKARLADFDLTYEADYVDVGQYVSDARFDARARRWHPRELDLGGLRPGSVIIVSIHPCHWDRNVAAKYARLAARVWSRVRAPRRGRAPRSPSRR